jgi:hypothetical protein
MRDLQRGRSSFAHQTVDGATLEAYLGLLALFRDSSHDARDSEIIVLCAAELSNELSAVDFGE